MRAVYIPLILFGWGGVSALAQQQPPAPVITTPVIQREVAAGQTFVGQLQPSRRSVVGSAVDGRVVELLVDDGDPVGQEPPGHWLATLQPAPWFAPPMHVLHGLPASEPPRQRRPPQMPGSPRLSGQSAFVKQPSWLTLLHESQKHL